MACDTGSRHAKRREDRQVQQFLLGLYSPYYSQTRASILALEVLPSLDRVYQMLIQDERVHLATQLLESTPLEAVGFSIRVDPTRGRGRDDRPDRSQLVCTRCKKTGHDVATCFELIGYPPHWHDMGGRGRGKYAGRGRGTVPQLVSMMLLLLLATPPSLLRTQLRALLLVLHLPFSRPISGWFLRECLVM